MGLQQDGMVKCFLSVNDLMAENTSSASRKKSVGDGSMLRWMVANLNKYGNIKLNGILDM